MATITIKNGTVTDTAGTGARRTVWITDNATGCHYRYTGTMAWTHRVHGGDPITLTATTAPSASATTELKRPRRVHTPLTNRALGERAYTYTHPRTGRAEVIEHPGNVHWAVLKRNAAGSLAMVTASTMDTIGQALRTHPLADAIVALTHIDRPTTARGAIGRTIAVHGNVTAHNGDTLTITDTRGYRYHLAADADRWTMSLTVGARIDITARVSGHTADRHGNPVTLIENAIDTTDRYL